MPRFQQPILTHLTDVRITSSNFTHLTHAEIPTMNSYLSHGCQDHNNKFVPISKMPRCQQLILIHLTDITITTTSSYKSHGYQDYMINEFLPLSKMPRSQYLILIHLTDITITTTIFLSISQVSELHQQILTHLTDAKIPTTNSYPSHGCQDYINQFLPIPRVSGLH